jgi:hypothetical protein
VATYVAAKQRQLYKAAEQQYKDWVNLGEGMRKPAA